MARKGETNLPKCKNCGGRTIKNGFRLRNKQQIQRYKCILCGHSFVEGVKETSVKSSVVCYHCGSYNIIKRGFTNKDVRKQVYHCKSCKKYFVENPSKTTLSDNEVTFINSFAVHLGVPMKHIAKELGRQEVTVQNTVKKYKKQLADGGPIIVPNIFRPKVSEDLKNSKPFTDTEKLYIYENYIRKGISYSQIMEEFHCSENAIRCIKRQFSKRS